MSDDIEAFLKRAAQRRQARQANQPAHQQQQTNRPGQPSSSRRERVIQAEPVLEAEIVEEPIARLVNRHLPDARLAEEVGLADEKVEEHLHDVFDHKVGRLRHQISRETVTTDDLTLNLLRLLRTHKGLQQAVLLREILDRPEHRW